MDYSIKIKDSSEVIVGSVGELLPRLLPDKRVVVVSDTNIDRHYHTLVNRYEHVLIGLGEASKTLVTADAIYKKFISMGVDRSTFVLAIGGGIVTDVAGFVASTYMRGVEFGFVSTSLLGQVDASVGGKNGVNVDGYKNMVGTFTQPRFVICDVGMLRTLPEREVRTGMAEVIKAGIIADEELFSKLELTPLAELTKNPDLLAEVVYRAIKVKADIVERDEREHGDRRKLNLGHTLAHAIEKSSSKMNHGEAVAVGLSLISDAAARREPENWRVPGSMRFLRELRQAGIRNYFVTGAVVERDRAGNPSGTMFEEISALGYEIGPGRLLEGLVGSSWQEKLPKRQIMLNLCRKLGISPEHLLVVGDGRSEIASGVEFGAVTVSRLPASASRAREIHTALKTNFILDRYSPELFPALFASGGVCQRVR